MAVITIMGATGFLGKYVVANLAAKGHQIRACARHAQDADKLRLAGAVGQVTPIAVDVNQAQTMEKAIEGADCLINLVGILCESEHIKFHDIHVEAAANMARLAKTHGVKQFIHLSALGVDRDASSHYNDSKAKGEEAIRAIYPDAVMLRPSVLFGPQDGFIHRFANLMAKFPIMPLINHGVNQFQPLYVGDLAKIMTHITDNPQKHHGKSYDLAGADIYSLREILEAINWASNRKVGFIPLPLWLSKIMAYLLGWVPNPLINPDMLASMQANGGKNILPSNAKGCAQFGIKPVSLLSVLPDYCDIYRQGGRFSPLSSPHPHFTDS